jgi:uncharacterized protein YciI
MMKNVAIALLIFTNANCYAQNASHYDAQLAQKLGADEYGMKTYVMAFLRSGPNRIKDSVASLQLQNAHLRNIMRLANEGKLIVAGPFLDNGDIRGIFIFNVTTVEEAKKLTETDPAIKAGVLIMELHPWYGTAALMATFEIHKKIGKKSVAD